jgi:hypothetical protein
MNSIKCPNCGLVNFSHDKVCKRCEVPLSASGSTRSLAPALNPPPPPIFHDGQLAYREPANRDPAPPCIKCGGREQVSIQNFVKVYNSPVAVLGIFLGVLPYILLKLILQKRHNITAPFCSPCWARYKAAKIYRVLNVLLFFVLLVGGITLSVYLDSEWMLLVGLLMPFVVLAVGHYYLNSFDPKYKKVTPTEVIIDAPFVGEILYTR